MLELIREHVVLVAHRAEELLGFICGTLSGHPYDPTLPVLTESIWWVELPHRNSRAGALLLDAFTKAGELADWVIFGLPPQTNIKSEAMLKRGYRYAERGFIKERA